MSAEPAQPVLTLSAPLAAQDLRSLLARLAHALDYDLGEADALLTTLRAGVANTPPEQAVARIAALIDVFDIDAAKAELKNLDITQ